MSGCPLTSIRYNGNCTLHRPPMPVIGHLFRTQVKVINSCLFSQDESWADFLSFAPFINFSMTEMVLRKKAYLL